VSPDERDRIAELLQDPGLSYRAIGRELGLSDWTIRRVARELDGDPTPMRSPRSRSQEPQTEGAATLTSWLVIGGIVAVFVLAILAGTRRSPPES
jgi:transposase-like protein